MKRLVVTVLMLASIGLGRSGPALAETSGPFRGTLVIPGIPGTVEGRAVFTGAINTVCVERNAVVTPVSGSGPEQTAQVTDQFDCPEGSIFNQATVTSTAQLDPTTCVFRQPQSGTFRFTGGTGQFAGTTAQGTLQAFAIGLLRRGPEGCNPNAPPVFVILVVNFTGNITVP